MEVQNIWKLPEKLIIDHWRQQLSTLQILEDLEDITREDSSYSKIVRETSSYLKEKGIYLVDDRALFFFNGQPFFYDAYFEQILVQLIHSAILILHRLVSGTISA
jgi:hypothetical protein